MNKNFIAGSKNTTKSPFETAQTSFASPELDLEKYRNELSELKLTEEQENEMLGILFSIMNSFVQLGFDVKNCGQIFESFTQAAQNKSDGLDSSHSSKQEKPTRGDRRHE